MAFPGATADHDAAAYVIVGAPLDVSATFHPGARFGPRRIREHAQGFEDYDHRTAQSFTELAVHDYGDVDAWDNAPEYLEYLEGVLRDEVDAGRVPLVLGGEHTVSVAGIEATRPDVFVSVDAHLDLRSSFDGNAWSHATVTYHALETAEKAVVIGARAGSREEWDRAEHDDVVVVSPEAVTDWEPDVAGTVYLSIDVDVVDPAHAPGTGTPEPYGLTPSDVRNVVRELAPSCVGFDVVEVTDRDHGQAALLGAKLLRDFVYTHAATKTR